MRLLRFSIMAGAVLAFALACGGGGTATQAPASQPAAAGCSGSAGTPVAIQDFSFSPTSITVAVGGVVTWANAGATNHTVTFDGGPDCGTVRPTATVTRTFAAAGSFAYKCTIHPQMTGTVVVQ